jgi:alkylated DNA nucleotide flippase Atl1
LNQLDYLWRDAVRKTWFEKMQDKPGYPKILILEEKFPCFKAVHKMGAAVGEEIVITNAKEVIPTMTAVPRGNIITLREICIVLANKHGVKGCCTLTAGIFVMTVANAVEEIKAKGDSSLLSEVPWWRTLKMDGFLNPKYPGGQEAQKALLEREGLKIIARGKKYQVANHEDVLFNFDYH